MLTLAASALAGGDCIDDADALRAGWDGCHHRLCSQGAVHPGDLPAEFPLGPRPPTGSVGREMLARAWDAGAGPGDDPLTIDLDSTVCETYGLAKEGAQHHNYAGQRGYHPLFAIAAGTGDVLMARLRKGRANTARGAAAGDGWHRPRHSGDSPYCCWEQPGPPPLRSRLRLPVRGQSPTCFLGQVQQASAQPGRPPPGQR